MIIPLSIFRRRVLVRAAVLATPLILAGCVMDPEGATQHREELKVAGESYQRPVEERALPEVPNPASWRDVLHRALLANGDLEAAYWEWNAAVAQIDQEAAYPNSNINLGFDYMFTRESMKAWDRTTLSAGFDPQTGGLMWPSKIAKAGDIALANARAAASRFAAAKFDLQKRVLSMYLKLALAEEKVRLRKADLSVLQLLIDTAPSRVVAGGSQAELHRLVAEKAMAENELSEMASEAAIMRAQLNGMLARPAESALQLPATLPSPRPLPVDDAALIAVAVQGNARLAELAHQMQGRKDAIELARQAYFPDISPTAAITGSISQAIGAMVTVPTNLPKIRGAIREQQAMLRSTQAMARQTRSDRAAEFVASLYGLRNAEHHERTLQGASLPALQRVVESAGQAYAAGGGELMPLLEAQRAVLDARVLLAEARVAREERLAEMEAIAGVDIETLTATTATTRRTESHQ